MSGKMESQRVGVEVLSKRLERHPSIEARVVRILDLIENAGGDVRRADDAERRAMEELRRMGQEVLNDWGQRLADEEALRLDADEKVVRQLKKTPLAQHVRRN